MAGLALVAISLAIFILLALVASWQAVRTEAGTAWLLSHVSGLKITGGKGRLQGGPYAAAKVEFDLASSPVHVIVDGLAWRELRWHWRPYPGAWAGLEIDGLQAQRVQVITRSTGGPASPPPKQLRLPVELSFPDAQVQSLQVDQLPPFTGVRARLHFGAEQGRVHRIDELTFAWDRLQLQAQGSIATGGEMPLKARARLQSQPEPGATGPMATAWTAQLDAQGPLQRIALDGHLQAAAGSPSATRLDLHTVVVPFAAWPLAELKAEMQSLDLSMLASAAPQTRIDGQAVVETSGLDRPARVDLQLSNASAGRWDAQQLPVRSLRLQLQGRPDQHDRLELQAFDAEMGTAKQPAGRWTGSGRWQGDTLALHTTLQSLQPSQLDGRLAQAVLSGPVDVELRGLPPSHEGWHAALDTRLDGRLPLKSAPPVQLRLKASAASDAKGLELDLAELQASAGPAKAGAQAKLHRAAGGGAWHVAGHGELKDFDPLPWWPGVEGSAWRQGGHRLNGRWQADVSLPVTSSADASLMQRLSGLRGQADLSLANSRLAGVPLQATAAFRADGKSPLATVAGELQAAGNTFKLDGRLALAGDGSADRWQLDTQASSLAALAPLARLVPALAAWEPKGGSAVVQAQAQGRWPSLASSGELRLSDLKAGTLSLAKAQAHWRFGGGPDAPLELKADLDKLQQGAQKAERIHADLGGTLRSHRLLLQADTAARPPAWADSLLGNAAQRGTSLLLAVDGAWQPAREGGRWSGRVQQLRAGPTGVPNAAWLVADGLQLDVGLGAGGSLALAEARPGQLQLLGASLRWTTLRWQAGTDGAPPVIDAQAQLDPLPVAPLLARLQPDFGWGGDLRVTGKVDVRSGKAFDADVVVERASGDLQVTDEGGTQALGLSVLRLGLEAHEGVWHFTEALAGSTVGVLAGAQSLRVGPRAVWPAPQTPMEGVLELRVDNLGVWGPWTPAGWRLAGRLHTSATLGGRFDAPEYTGVLEGEGIGARNLLQGVNVSDGDVRIALKGPVAQIERFTLKGGDGELRLEGGASFGETPRAQLKLEAVNFQLLGRVDRRIVTSGRGEMSLDKDAVRLDGRFVVDEGLIDFSRSGVPTLDDDVTVVRRNPGGGAGTASTSNGSAEPEDSAPASAAKPPRQVQALVQVDLGNKLRIRGHGIDTLLRGELRMTTPGGRLAVNGTVRAEEGTYAAYGQKLDITRGVLTFTGPVENPRLDILALRPNLDVQVGVSVGGTALSPRVRLYSEPDMADTDKLSWLVLGRAPEGLGRTDTALLQRAAMALLSGEGESTTDKVLHALGLDDFQVRQESEGDVRNTVVSLGKQISRRWYVGYERGVNSTIGSWQLIYRIAQRFTLRAQSGEDNALDLIWTWRWN